LTSSINPLAALPAKANECQGSDGRQTINAAKLPLRVAGRLTCAALDIHSAERTIGGGG